MSFEPLRNGLSGLPLDAMSAVVADTETTGLDTKTARIIEIAAVRISEGIIASETFAELINPDEPIPENSTKIHGLSDGDVADARAFLPVMQDLSGFVGGDILIGFSLGFDLAILKAEHQRVREKWSPPRCLDVRHLVQIVAPELPEHSLEAVAGWLGIEIKDRHRALGDAETTAKVFLALIPKLRARGIVTLAQAERASRTLDQRLSVETSGGWENVIAGGAGSAGDRGALARIDSYPYRHRVADIMKSPPFTISPASTMREALGLMMQNRISSVFVLPSDQHAPYQILTERDVLRAINAAPKSALDTLVDKHASGPLVTIDDSQFVYRAITKMASKNFRHLGVVDENGVLVGALSARDLLKQRAGDAMSLGDNIEAAKNPAELGRIWETLITVTQGLVAEDVDVRHIAGIISQELRALTRRATELAQEAMEAEGHGPAPMDFSMMVLGSGGRGESLLAMDQDNAIIYAEGEPGSDADKWFEALGAKAADTLDAVGVCYCKGGIMAKNAEWRMDAERWRDTVGSWMQKARPEDLMNCDIFFDAMPVYGSERLALKLRSDALNAARDQKVFIKNMSMKAAEFKSPLGFMGRISTDNGRVDLKIGGIMPIFSAARVLALEHGISERATPARLAAARDRDVPGAHVIDSLIDAHKILLNAILRQQLRDIETGIDLSNTVELAALDAHEKQELKWALEQSPSISSLLDVPTQF